MVWNRVWSIKAFELVYFSYQPVSPGFPWINIYRVFFCAAIGFCKKGKQGRKPIFRYGCDRSGIVAVWAALHGYRA